MKRMANEVRRWWRGKVRARRLDGLRRTLAIEGMEQRAMFVVGALAPVPPAAPTSASGVVRLGGTSLDSTSPTCSASLLSTGRHLLTAAHCIVQNAKQEITLTDTTAGQFTLSFNGATTWPLPFNASANAIESALEALPNIDNVNVSTGPADNDPSTVDRVWDVEFRGSLAVSPVAAMTINSVPGNPLVGPAPSVAVKRSGAPFVGASRFDLSSGNYTIVNLQTAATVHPQWNGLYLQPDGNEQPGDDIAIIELASIAPQSAQRYGVYTDRDEVGQTFLVTGYGRTGVGATGENAGPPDTANQRRVGVNQFGGVSPTNKMLQSDFDDGTQNQDSLNDGLGLGPQEVAVARGDSGGGALLGLKVAGINSAVDASGLGGFSAFGDVNFFTRVSDFTNNRDPSFDIATILAKPGDIVLDMGVQDAGNDGVDDEILARRIGPNGQTVQLLINGQEVWSGLRSRMLSLTIRGSADDETIRIEQNLGLPVTVSGGPGHDQLFGSSGVETLQGMDGPDRISSGGGADTLDGGDGVDQLVEDVSGKVVLTNSALTVNGVVAKLASFEVATLQGGKGNDEIRVNGFGLNVTVFGGQGNDRLFGDAFANHFFGQAGNDTIDAGGGADIVDGGIGNDRLYGGAGKDTLFGDAGNDLIFGQADDDWLDGGEGNDQLAGEGGDDTLYGQGGADTITGGFFSNQPDLVPDAGDDYLDGGDGNDRLMGDSGAISQPKFATLIGGKDTILGGRGNDLIFGMVGNDKLFGGADQDILVGGAGHDQMDGEAGDDTLNGEAGNDSLAGGEGSDTLGGGEGNDLLVGGTVIGVADPAADKLDGGADNDTLYGDSVTFEPLVIDVLVGGADTLQGGLGNDLLFGQAGADFIGGGEGDDVIDTGAGADIANGDAGSDTLHGGEDDDLLAGGPGNDHVDGDAGNDLLVGDRFSNTKSVIAEAGHDTLDGGEGNDRLYGDSFALGAPTAYGTTGGGDTLAGGDGDDFLAGQSGDDRLDGGEDDDTLEGWNGDDFARGGEGDDVIRGGAGDDVLTGDGGLDSLEGGLGRDVLIGGRQADRLSGGADEDLLVSGIVMFPLDPAILPALLSAVHAEWTSPRTYAERVANIKGIDNPTFNARFNGDLFLIKGNTVIDDDAADVVLGESGKDWLIFDDVLDTQDGAPGEQLN